MTFKKNLFVMVTAIVLVCAASYLVKIPWDMFVSGMTFVLAVGALILALEDLWRKFMDHRDQLTWQYFVGFLLILGSIVSFLWAAESVENKAMILRLGLCVFSSLVGAFWMCNPYRKSLQDDETKIVERWERDLKKVKRAKTQAKASKALNQALRYRLFGDSLDGGLDFNAPLGLYKGEPKTYQELMESDDDGSLGEIRNQASEYIELLVCTLDLQEPAMEV